MDGKTLYGIHWEATFEMLSWALPFWENLSWQEQMVWEDRAVEQGRRDSGTLPSELERHDDE